jgi:hypothetical protein
MFLIDVESKHLKEKIKKESRYAASVRQITLFRDKWRTFSVSGYTFSIQDVPDFSACFLL